MKSFIKRFGPGILVLAIVGLAFGWKFWQHAEIPVTATPASVQGPAVILFRGDNSSGCRAIHRLVDEAAAHYDGRIHFTSLDWAAGAPLIEQYQVRFLPTVVLLDRRNREVGRIVGESPEVQRKLEQTLTQLDALLEH